MMIRKCLPQTGMSWRLSGVLLAATFFAVSPAALAVSVPVLSVSVNGALTVSFANDQVCSGTKAVLCLGTGAEGDLIISSFELSADPDPYVTGAFNFYNASLTNTISVVATILFPMTGTFASPQIALGTGLVNNVFGGGILNLTVKGFVDSPGLPLAVITAISPGVPFSVCDNLGADPGCQNSISSLSISQPGPLSLNVLSAIGLQLTFDLSPDTTATIGLDPSEAFNGAAYFSVTPQQAVVPVPGAAWLFFSGLGALGALRRFAPGT